MGIIQRTELGSVAVVFTAGAVIEVRHDTLTIDEDTGAEVASRSFTRTTIAPVIFTDENNGVAVAREPDGIAQMEMVGAADVAAVARLAWTPERVASWLGDAKAQAAAGLATAKLASNDDGPPST